MNKRQKIRKALYLLTILCAFAGVSKAVSADMLNFGQAVLNFSKDMFTFLNKIRAVSELDSSREFRYLCYCRPGQHSSYDNMAGYLTATSQNIGGDSDNQAVKLSCRVGQFHRDGVSYANDNDASNSGYSCNDFEVIPLPPFGSVPKQPESPQPAPSLEPAPSPESGN